MNLKPMKAEVLEDNQLKLLRYPLLASLKLDGIRSLNKNGVPLSTSLNPIRNKYVQLQLSFLEYHGLDGELLLTNHTSDQPGIHDFNLVSSAIMNSNGEPDFTYWLFEDWSCDLPAILRYKLLTNRYNNLHNLETTRLRLLEQHLIESEVELLQFENIAISQGYEGIMLKSVSGKYKFGTSTLREQYLMKRKPFADSEGVIIGFEPEYENTNVAIIDNLGHFKRSSAKVGKVAKDTLGKFIVRTKRWGEFPVGKGRMTHAMGKQVWDNQDKYLDSIIVFKYQKMGTLNSPRLPIFKGFRYLDDLTKSKDQI